MANRFTTNSQWTLLKGVTELWAAVSVSGVTPTLLKWNYPGGNTAAPGTYSPATTSGAGASGFGATAGAEGILSVARQDAGEWLVTFQDKFSRVLGVDFIGREVGGSVGVANCTLAGDIDGGFFTTSCNSVYVIFNDYDGNPADPSDESTVVLHFTLQNSTAP